MNLSDIHEHWCPARHWEEVVRGRPCPLGMPPLGITSKNHSEAGPIKNVQIPFLNIGLGGPVFHAQGVLLRLQHARPGLTACVSWTWTASRLSLPCLTPSELPTAPGVMPVTWYMRRSCMLRETLRVVPSSPGLPFGGVAPGQALPSSPQALSLRHGPQPSSSFSAGGK